MAPVDAAPPPTARQDALQVEVAHSPGPGAMWRRSLRLDAGATVMDALQSSGLLSRHPELDVASLKLGIWGRPCTASDALREGDRVEVYRPLRVDPKEARRERYQTHRASRPSRAEQGGAKR